VADFKHVVAIIEWNVLHRHHKEAMYKETIDALEDCFGDQHLVAGYCDQLNTNPR
jgi:hypothetical protein